MALDIIFILRIVQALFAIIVLGLSAYAVSQYNALNDNYYYAVSPSRLNFMVFVSLWTLLVVTFITVASRFVPKLSHPFVVLALDALTMLFWFAGFIALAVSVSAFGAICYGHLCDSMRAATAFGAFEWLLFAATTVLGALNFRKGHSGNKTTTHVGTAV